MLQDRGLYHSNSAVSQTSQTRDQLDLVGMPFEMLAEMNCIDYEKHLTGSFDIDMNSCTLMSARTLRIQFLRSLPRGWRDCVGSTSRQSRRIHAASTQALGQDFSLI